MPNILTVSTIPGNAQFTRVQNAIDSPLCISGAGTDIQVETGDYTNHEFTCDKDNVAVTVPGAGPMLLADGSANPNFNPAKFHMELRPIHNKIKQNAAVTAFRAFGGVYSTYDIAKINTLIAASKAAGPPYVLTLPDNSTFNWVGSYISANSLGQSLAMKGIVVTKKGTRDFYCSGIWVKNARSTSTSSGFSMYGIGSHLQDVIFSDCEQGVHASFQHDAQGREIGYTYVIDYMGWNNGDGGTYHHDLYLGAAARIVVKPIWSRNSNGGHLVKVNPSGGVALVIGGDCRDGPKGTVVFGAEILKGYTSDSAFDGTSGSVLLVNFVGVQMSKGKTGYYDDDRSFSEYGTFAMLGGYLENGGGSLALNLQHGTFTRVPPVVAVPPLFTYLDRATLVGSPESDNARNITDHVEVGVQRFPSSNEAATIMIDVTGMPPVTPANFRALLDFFRSKADPIIVGAFDRFDIVMDKIEAYEGGVIIPPPPLPTGEDPVEIARLTALLAAATQAIADAQAAATAADVQHQADLDGLSATATAALALKTAELDAANVRAKAAEDALANSGGAAAELAKLRSDYAALSAGLAPGAGP